MADIFVSYTSSDHDWAFWIALELEKLGHVAHVHEWEIKGGDDIYGWMESRLETADRVLCVVSDEYLKAPYSTLERHAALWQAAAKRPGFVLLVAVKTCKLPTLADHIRRCELFGIPENAARLRFRQFMEAPVKPDAVPFPVVIVFAVSNIPIRVPEHFLGRDDAIEAIDAALRHDEGRIAALHGLRGVGKTTLAAAYAERHRSDYRATWWIRAQTPDTMRADLVALGVRLGWVAADEKEEPALAAVRERLRDEGEGLLLIYDNAINAGEVEPFLPLGGPARVIITSNAPDWRGIAVPVEIEVWPKQVGAEYLIARTGRDCQRAEGEALSEALGGLPLAHQQAAVYCERLGISLADYNKRFDAAWILDKDAPTEYHDRLTVAKSFALAIDEAAKLHPAAKPLIVDAALLAAEPIPLFIFSEGREKFGEPLASQLAVEGLDEAVAALRAFALVDRETIPDERDPAIKTDTIRLHRLVRTVAAAQFKGEAAEEARGVLVQAMAAVYPDDVSEEDPTTWPRKRRLDALALDLVGGAAAVPKGSEASASSLLKQLGTYRRVALGTYSQARPLFERALAICDKELGPEHPDTASSLNALGILLEVQGDFGGARPLYERGLAIYEKARGPDHLDIAANLGNLARALQGERDFARARPLFERALTIYEKARGPEHFDTALGLNNLATLLYTQGDVAGARPLFERALAICERERPKHPYTATSLSNLASLLEGQGDLAGARALFERALAIRETVLGPEHPDTAASRRDLARVRRDL